MGRKSEQAAPEPDSEGNLWQVGLLWKEKDPDRGRKHNCCLPLRYKVTNTTGKPLLSVPYPPVSALTIVRMFMLWVSLAKVSVAVLIPSSFIQYKH